MERSEALDVLVSQELQALSLEDRDALLADWWSIDADDEEFEGLPPLLKAALERSEQPGSSSNKLYDPLIRLALRDRYVGVRNEFITERLAGLLEGGNVVGTVEALEACPCCSYRTLRERGSYDICMVCFWEDDGTAALDAVSGPNRMSLCVARQNFATFGAVSPDARNHVDVLGTRKFDKDRGKTSE